MLNKLKQLYGNLKYSVAGVVGTRSSTTSFKTMLLGIVFFPDRNVGWIKKYFQYNQRVIYPSPIMHTIEHLTKRDRVKHVQCEGWFYQSGTLCDTSHLRYEII